MKVNIDKVNMVPQDKAAQRTFGLVDTIQDYRPEERVVAVACLFSIICEHYGITGTKMWELANNVMRDAEGHFIPEFQGIRRYMKEEG